MERRCCMTVKLHLLERHAISQMCAFDGGLGTLVEDWVERYHQIGFQLEEQNKRTSTLEGRVKAFSEHQELINNVEVMNRDLQGRKVTSRGPRKKRNLSERQGNQL